MKEIENYIINDETLLVMPYMDHRSKVYELDGVFLVDREANDIIRDSCLYFGSSYEGRKEGTKHLINCEMKVPIIIEDTKLIIVFPTCSYRNSNNMWISYKNLLKYAKLDSDNSVLYFKDNNNITINVRYNIIDNQIIRCIKLESIFNKRKISLIKSEK